MYLFGSEYKCSPLLDDRYYVIINIEALVK